MTAIAACLRAPWLWPTALATVLLLAACAPRDPYPLPEPSHIPFGQGRAWQVAGPEIETSYVFGTLQAYDKRLLVLPEAVERAFAASQVLALEDFGGLYGEGGVYNVDTLKLPAGDSLESLIGGRSFGILTWHMERSELRPKDNIKPWAFWLYMGGLNWGFVDDTSLYRNRADASVADWLQDRARRERKEVVDLETVRERFEIFDEMPLQAQADMLKVRLDGYSEGPHRVPKVQLYLDGDLASFDALWRQYLTWLQPATATVLDDRLINKRNPVMVERIVPLMREGATFVAVDIRHLPGEEGILRLLEQRGFAVTRLH